MLKPKQFAAVQYLVQGYTYADTAREVGVRPNTITRWLDDPEFVAHIETYQRVSLQIASAGLNAGLTDAVNCIREIVNDTSASASVRLKAANSMISQAARAYELTTKSRRELLEWDRNWEIDTIHRAMDPTLANYLFQSENNMLVEEELKQSEMSREEYTHEEDMAELMAMLKDQEEVESERMDPMSMQSPLTALAAKLEDGQDDSIARWQDKVVRTESVDLMELLDVQRNWRRPQGDRSRSIIVNEITGLIVAGHTQAQLALNSGEETVSVTYVRLSEEEEAQALAELVSYDDDQDSDDVY